MTEPMLYRVVDEHPYLDREEEHANRSAEEAAAIFEDLTGEKADEVLAELDEACSRCGGKGTDPDRRGATSASPCTLCFGDGKRHDPIEWEDNETGRTVTLRPEVS